MTNPEDIPAVANEIKNKFITQDRNGNTKNISILYAFNGVGKTLLSNEFTALNTENKETGEITYKTLCYSAFLEDLFHWDNEENILYFNEYSWESKLIRDESLENKISDNFKHFLNTEIEPSFYIPAKIFSCPRREGENQDRWKEREKEEKKGKVTFGIYGGNDENITKIKISRGEESILIWTVFYTILETAIDVLNQDQTDRSTHMFDALKYVIIDDPVSSIDDTRIINLASGVSELVKLFDNQKILITTHHPLFYNVLFNSIKRNKRNALILQKTETDFILKGQNDSPFSYHLFVKNEIEKAIADDNIQRYHFNMFRGLLEKTVNFLGLKSFNDCIIGDNAARFIRVLHLYSHSKLSDIEHREVSPEDKELFKEVFNNFIDEFKWQD